MLWLYRKNLQRPEIINSGINKLSLLGLDMRHAVSVICMCMFLLLSGISMAQPFIYRTEGGYARHAPETLEKFDLQAKRWITCLSEVLAGSYGVDNKDEWVVMQWDEVPAEAFNLTDSDDYIALRFSQEEIGKVINAHNQLYIFAKDLTKDTAHLYIVNLSSGKEATTFTYFRWGDETKDAFFSGTDSIIYFTVDTVYSDIGIEKTKVVAYSVAKNKIIKEQYLYELGYPGAEINELCFGKAGLGIIGSYSRDTANKNSYYRLHDFDKNTNSAFIHYVGYADPYFTNNGKYLVLVESSYELYDSSDSFSEYKTGKISLYEASSGMLLRVLSLPSHGEVKYSELYPDEVYYACDLDSLPQVYRIKPDSLLAAKRIDGVSSPTRQAGTGGFTIDVTGKGFTPASKVFWNDSAGKTIFVSDSLLKVKISDTDVAATGDSIVRVNFDGVSSSASDSMVFHVVNASEKPKR